MSFWSVAEADVQAFIGKVQAGIAWAETELDNALSWVVNNTPMIVADIEKAVGFATEIGATANPEVALAISAAQAAITALNAAANAKQTGSTDVQVLLSGYTAIKQAQAASASAVAGATTHVATTVAAAAAPPPAAA